MSEDEVPNGEGGRPSTRSGFQRLAVIFNPIKSQDVVATYVDAIKRRDPALAVDVFTSKNSDDVEMLARKACEENYDVIVSAGGDGTLWRALNPLVHKETVLAPLPLGTGNDLSRTLGIETVEDAVRAIFEGTVRTLDVGRCAYFDFEGEAKESYFCSTAGVGMMANVFKLEKQKMSQVLKGVLGNAIWPLLTVYSALSFSSFESELQLNSRAFDRSLLLFEISNVPEAGGFAFTPGAAPDRGIFDAWMLPDVSFLRILALFGKVSMGGQKHLALPHFEYFCEEDTRNSLGIHNLTQIALAPQTPVPVHLQGDLVGQTPVQFEMEAQALKVLALP